MVTDNNDNNGVLKPVHSQASYLIPNDNHNLSIVRVAAKGNQEDNPLGLLDDFKRAEGLTFEELASLLE
ncbi:hypothetical protein ACOSP7_021205 [Xanthoceras sorbifolium]